MDKKMMAIANFNLVFFDKKEKEYPLLDYFDSIVMPAFLSGIKRKVGDSKYYILNADVIDLGEENYVLVGNFVRETKLVVKSEVDEKGALRDCDYSYPTAPYSTFAIYLKNHRMVFVQNQKGSPTLRNFETTVSHILHEFIKEENKKFLEIRKLPFPELNVTAIPTKGKVKEVLRGAKTINSLTLRFYPLNGDLDYSGLFSVVSNDVRKAVGSRNGEIILKTPKNLDGVAELLESSDGTIEPIVRVTYPDNSQKTIKNNKIAEKIEINVENPNGPEERKYIALSGLRNSAVNGTNEVHENIYKTNKDKIIKLLKSKNK